MMDNKPRALNMAQMRANSMGKDYSVLNLDTVGEAMYIVRPYEPAHEVGPYGHQFVCKVSPEKGRDNG